MRSYDRAVELAAELTAADVPAVTDVRDVLGKAPCVLLTPPRLAFDGLAGATATFQLVAVAGSEVGTSTTWQELDDLVAAVAEVLPVQSAAPSSYVLGPELPARPAYLLELVTSVPYDD